MSNILYKGLIGEEDIQWGDIEDYPETYTRKSSLGTITMTKIPNVFKYLHTAQYYDAIGDGSTDDTAAISAMFAANISNSTEFDGLNKTYKLTSPVSVTMAAGTTWKIKNFRFTTSTISNPSSETGSIKITGNESITAGVWSGSNKVMMENVTFTDNATTADAVGNLDGIYLTNLDEIHLKNVRVTNYNYTGIYLALSRNVYVENCDSGLNLYAGIRTGNLHTCVIIGGTYNTNGKSYSTDGYGIAFAAGDQVNSSVNIHVAGVTANWNYGQGIDFHAGRNIKVIGNHIKGFGYCGIYAIAGATGNIVNNVIIQGNTVVGDSTLITNGTGIYIGAYGAIGSPPGDFIVSDNIITDTNTATNTAIEIDAMSTEYATYSVTVANNRILNGSTSNSAVIWQHGTELPLGDLKICNNIIHSVAATYGIRVENTSNTTIDGNQITIDSGTVTEAINCVYSTSYYVSINNNLILGAATYTSTLYNLGTGGILSWTAHNNKYLGTLLRDVNPYGVSVDYGNDVPTAADGYYGRGSIRLNSAAATGAPGGWSCVTAGVTGGTAVWKAWANLPA